MMKRNSKQTKGWGFKFMAILSSIMMVINTVTPVVPVFAESEIAPSNDEVVDVSAENPAPAEENTPAEKPAEDADTANNNADKPATVETPKTAEDSDKPADSQTITEQTDGNQNSGAKNDTSNGSDEKENNNTDQSLQNGEEPTTVDTPKADVDTPAEDVKSEEKSETSTAESKAESVENEEAEDGLNKEIITGRAEFDGVVVTVVAPEKSFPEGTEVIIKTIEEDPIVALDILQKEEQLESQVNANENVEIQKKVSFDISFFDPKNPGIEPEPVEGKQVSVVFDYKDNDEFANANKNDIAVYHLEETTDNSASVEAESKDTLSLNEVKKEIKEDLTDEYKDAISEADKNQSVGVVVDVTEFSVYTLAIKKDLSNTISEGTLLLDSNGGNFTAGNIIVDNSCTSNCQGSIESTNFSNHSGTIILPTVTREGYEFIGWFGGNKVGNAGQSIMIGSGKTVKNGGKLVAQFKKNTCDTNDDSLVACIGSIGYTSLPAAVSEVLTNNTATTIKLLKDVSGPGVQIKPGQNIIFDLNNHTYTVANPTVGSAGTETNGFQMLKGSTVTFKDGGLESSTAKILLQNYCDLTLDNVKVNTQKNPQMQYASSNNFGSLNVKGNSEIHGSEGQVAFDIWYGMSSEYDNGVIVKFDENFSGIVDGTVQYGHHSRVTDESWREKAALIISGGNFDIVFEEESTDALSGANIKISGGKFEKPVDSDYLVEGLDWTTDSDGKYVLTDASHFEAQIGDAKYTTLAVAIAAVPTDGTLTEIILLKDAGSESLGMGISNGKNIKLNLNGKTLTYNYVLVNGRLDVYSGVMVGKGNFGIFVYGTADTTKNAGEYSYLRINSGVTVKGDNYAIVFWPSANSDAPGYGAKIDIYGKLENVLFVSGNSTSGNSEINMYGTIDSPREGIAQNGYSVVNIYTGAKITAALSAVETRAGDLNIYGGEFKSTATEYSCNSNGNGTTSQGTAIAVAQHTTALNGNINIQGGVFTGIHGIAICNPESNTGPTPQLSIKGGSFNGSENGSGVFVNAVGYTNPIKNFIEGGTFSSPVAEEYCAAGYVSEDLGNGKYGVKEGEYVAQIGDKKYESLPAAVADALSGETVTLLKDSNGNVRTITGNGVMIKTANCKTVTIDFNGNTYEVGGTPVGSTNTESQVFHLEKGCTVTLKNGTLSSDNRPAMLVQNYSNLTLENITLDGTKLRGSESYAMSNNDGKIIIGSGTVINAKADGYAFDVCVTNYYPDGAKVTVENGATINGRVQYDVRGAQPSQNKTSLNIKGGTFNGSFVVDSVLSGDAKEKFSIEGGTFSEAVNPDYCADNYIPKDLGNGKYSVELGHKLTFKYDNGDDDTLEFIPNGSITVQPTPNPSKTGYTFTGWYTTGVSVTKFTFGSTLSRDTELYAHWDVNNYKVQFNNDGATTPGTTVLYYTYGQPGYFANSNHSVSVNSFNKPTKDGFEFKGYYTANDWQTLVVDENGNFVQDITNVVSPDGSVTYIARWTAGEYLYTLSGAGANHVTYLDTNTVAGTKYSKDYTIKLGSTPDAGYELSGWKFEDSDTNELLNITLTNGEFSMPGRNILVTPIVNPITYTITYELNDGTNDENNPATYTIESENITLSGATKDQYEFQGWYTDANFGGATKITGITKGSIGNKVLYAKFEKCVAKISGNTTCYPTLEDALAAISTVTSSTHSNEKVYKSYRANGTIEVLADSKGKGIIIDSNSNLTINFNGHKYEIVSDPVGSNNTETIGLQLLKDSNIIFNNGEILSTTSDVIWLIQNYSNLTLNNMTLSLKGYYYTQRTLNNNNGKIIIYNSTINAADFTWLGYPSTTHFSGFALGVSRYASYTGTDVTIKGNSIINGDLAVSVDNGDPKDGLSLTLENGTLNGDIVVDDSVKVAMENNSTKTTVTKKDTFTQTAPEGFEWKSNSDGTSTLSIIKYRIDFLKDGVSLWSGDVNYGDTPACVGCNTGKNATVQTGYTFAGWTPAIIPATGNQTYTATYDETTNQYTVTIVSSDTNSGTISTNTVTVDYGTAITYSTNTLTISGTTITAIPETDTEQYKFSFTSWDFSDCGENNTVTGNCTITGNFASEIQKYTVTWKNGNNTVETDTDVEYGSTPSYNGTEPTKDPDDQYTYTFAGWTPSTGNTITGNTEFTATFTPNINKYNIQFVKEDGSEILSGYYDYGTGLTDIIPSAPDKTGYTFVGWTPAVIAVTGAQVYTATYTINQYGITFVDSGDVVAIVTGNYTSGITAPTISDKAGYTFSGWYDSGDNWIDFSTYKIPVNGETLHAVWTPEEVEFTVKYFTERLDGEWAEQSSDRLVVLRKAGTIITGELKNYTGFITPEIQTGIVKGNGQGKIQYKYQRSGFNVEYVCENCGDLSSSASAVPASGTYLYETGMKVENAMAAPGYTFKWNMDGNVVQPGESFTMPAHDVVITGTFLSGTANYTVEYYYQNADGSYPATANSGVIRTGTTDTLASVTDEDKTPTEVGYTLYNTGLNILSKAIDGDGDAILKVYFKKQFIVKYLSGNHGAFADEIHTGLDYGTGTPAAPTPIAQSGYSFSGWDIEPAVTVTADATYTAQWTANSYTVNFNSGGATSGTMNPQVFTYADGTTSYPLTAIGYEKEGYTFSGWTDGVNKYTDKADIVELLKAGSGTLNLTAEWTANSYTVTYKANSGVGTDFTGTATYDENYAISDNQGFTREGYEFSGWNTQTNGNGTSYATGDSISPWKFTGDLTLYAQWTEVARTVNSQAELVAALAVPTIETITIGSSFDVESSVIIDRAVTIDGSGNTISMSGNQEWVSGGHNYIFKVYPASSADITIKDLTLTHALGAMIVGPNASVEVDNVDVSGNIWGGVEVIGTLSGNLIISDEKYEKPAAWIDASTITTQIVNLPGTTSGVIKNQVQYYYNPLHSTFFTITFDANSGSAVDAMTGIYDATITLPGSTRDGYTFSGWKAEDGTKYNSGASYTISGNATLTLVWDTVKYNITYHLDGGIEPTPANVTGYTIEESVTLTAPTKTGYTFLGWTGVNQSLFSGEAITIGTTGDKEFTANWQINEYRVNYHTGGHGALIESYTGVNYGASIPQTSLANVEGWTFSGWTLSGGGVIPATMPAHDIDLVAEWTIKSHNLTYSYVGTVPAGAPTGYTGTESVEYGSGITLKGTPAMSGYTFSGWILSGATATSNSFTMPDNDIEILGEWIVQQFTITFDTDGGTDVAPITQDYNTSVTAPTPAPTKTGYQFSGWNPAVPATMPAENMIITGEWTANIYTVNFNSGGATSGTMNPQVFTYADATTSYPLTANVFEKEGYTFSGWTDGANKYADGADVIELIKANSGTLDLTAEWKVNSHLLKYVVDGTEVYTGILNYGDPITQYQNPTKDCNSFAGWTSNVEGITTGSTMPDSDVTFTANWNYTCTRSSGGGGGGGSSRNNTNNMQEVVLGGEVEVNTGDKAEINTGDENKLDENNDEGKGSIGNTQGYDPELVEAYKWAYKNGITTMPTIEEARLKDGITRAELAKMMVVFMSEVLHRQPVITETFDYPDVNEKALGDLTGYIQLAYQYQIMGIQADGKPLNKFNPRGKVSRAEFATVLSRVLYGSVNNQKGANYREKHIEALNKAGILTNTNPKIQELRGWIILMLYRSQNSETNNVEENTAQVTTGDVAEVESGSAVEVATGTTAEIATGEVAQITTGNVAEVESGSTAEITTGTTGAVVEANTGSVAQTAIAGANTGDVAKVESGSTAEVATGDSK